MPASFSIIVCAILLTETDSASELSGFASESLNYVSRHMMIISFYLLHKHLGNLVEGFHGELICLLQEDFMENLYARYPVVSFWFCVLKAEVSIAENLKQPVP